MNEITRQRFYSYVTKTRFLHLEDSLEIGKVRLFVGEYQRGHGATATAHHYLDVSDARVLFSDMAWGKAVEFTDYKGSSNGSQPQSRILKIRHKADGNEARYWLEIQNGPGQIMGQGAIKPAGDPTAQISIPLPIWEGRRLAHAALAYLRAWEINNLSALDITQPDTDSPEMATDQAAATPGQRPPQPPPVTNPPAVATKTPPTSPAGVATEANNFYSLVAQAVEAGVPLDTIDEIVQLGANGPGGWTAATQAISTARLAHLNAEPSKFAGGRLALIERVQSLLSPAMIALIGPPEPLWQWLWSQDQIVQFGQAIKSRLAA